jgi:hypothetical protein
LVPSAAKASWPLIIFVEGLFGDLESNHSSGHPTIKYHLGDDLGYLLFGHAHVQSALDVPLHQPRSVPQHNQGCDGA